MGYRFEDKFYNDIWNISGHDIKKVHTICMKINNKINELCGLVSPQGALQILKGKNE